MKTDRDNGRDKKTEMEPVEAAELEAVEGGKSKSTYDVEPLIELDVIMVSS